MTQGARLKSGKSPKIFYKAKQNLILKQLGKGGAMEKAIGIGKSPICLLAKWAVNVFGGKSGLRREVVINFRVKMRIKESFLCPFWVSMLIRV